MRKWPQRRHPTSHASVINVSSGPARTLARNRYRRRAPTREGTSAVMRKPIVARCCHRRFSTTTTTAPVRLCELLDRFHCLPDDQRIVDLRSVAAWSPCGTLLLIRTREQYCVVEDDCVFWACRRDPREPTMNLRSAANFTNPGRPSKHTWKRACAALFGMPHFRRTAIR